LFSIYEPIFAYMNSFLSQTNRCSRREVTGNYFFVARIFALRAVLEERIKLVNRGITVFDLRRNRIVPVDGPLANGFPQLQMQYAEWLQMMWAIT
jgi:hypothetical protein